MFHKKRSSQIKRDFHNLNGCLNVKATSTPRNQQNPLSGIYTFVMTRADPTPSATCKKHSANDPINIETLSMGITGLKIPLCTNPTSQMTTTFQSANATLGELTEEFHTANDELPPGNPCASSTGRREVTNEPLMNPFGPQEASSSLHLL